jgi:hypothetical protein
MREEGGDIQMEAEGKKKRLHVMREEEEREGYKTITNLVDLGTQEIPHRFIKYGERRLGSRGKVRLELALQLAVRGAPFRAYNKAAARG